jgi:pyruvate/2-oxoglutarate dehydrogenase complex dihydrolipoamide dehydrogenase (E3) component
MKHVHGSIETIRIHENADYFRNMGIDVVLGEARFVDKNKVQVGDTVYSARDIIIATGSKPRRLSVPGIELAHVVTNENIFNLRELPKKLVVIGTGPIGIELGQAFLMLGSQVTFVGVDDRILPREKGEYAEVLYSKLQEQGAVFHFSSDVLRVDNKNVLVIKNKITNEETVLDFDTLLVSIGRQLTFSSLQLEKAGIEVKEGKIIVNEYLQTTNKHVYLCGDVAGSYQFTHAAEVHAKVLLTNFFSPLKKKVRYDTFSWVTYTTPEIATFGQQEEVLNKKKIPYEVISTPFEDDDRAIADMNRQGKSEVYVHTKTKQILGGTMVANNAGELVQELLLVMSAKLPISVLFDKIYPYPTATRINKKLIARYYKLHFTSFSKKLLKFLYRLTQRGGF